MFLVLALYQFESQLMKPNYTVILPTDAAHSFFRDLSLYSLFLRDNKSCVLIFLGPRPYQEFVAFNAQHTMLSDYGSPLALEPRPQGT